MALRRLPRLRRFRKRKGLSTVRSVRLHRCVVEVRALPPALCAAGETVAGALARDRAEHVLRSCAARNVSDQSASVPLGSALASLKSSVSAVDESDAGGMHIRSAGAGNQRTAARRVVADAIAPKNARATESTTVNKTVSAIATGARGCEHSLPLRRCVCRLIQPQRLNVGPQCA